MAVSACRFGSSIDGYLARLSSYVLCSEQSGGAAAGKIRKCCFDSDATFQTPARPAEWESLISNSPVRTLGPADLNPRLDRAPPAGHANGGTPRPAFGGQSGQFEQRAVANVGRRRPPPIFSATSAESFRPGRRLHKEAATRLPLPRYGPTPLTRCALTCRPLRPRRAHPGPPWPNPSSGTDRYPRAASRTHLRE